MKQGLKFIKSSKFSQWNLQMLKEETTSLLCGKMKLNLLLAMQKRISLNKQNEYIGFREVWISGMGRFSKLKVSYRLARLGLWYRVTGGLWGAGGELNHWWLLEWGCPRPAALQRSAVGPGQVDCCSGYLLMAWNKSQRTSSLSVSWIWRLGTLYFLSLTISDSYITV